MTPTLLPANYGSYDVLAALAPEAQSYLGIGVQEGECVMHVVRANPKIRRLVLCDTWGFEHGGTGRGSHDHIETRLFVSGFGGETRFLDGMSQTLVPRLTERFDLVYVDGDHSEAGALADLRNSWPLLDGAMVVHDIRMESVWSALMRFLDTVPVGLVRCAFCNGGHGTAVVYRIRR